ncbi:hypothetical protein AM499_19180 [Bacillus sp. FJAT-22090]|uniref:hypothetical protein n=1 Tax=Bacillus sp. FJAT-22090 TaxID=1581038 RepID=UPI0006AF0169|nr:hypothetical protein [Bacillus sp. FJAT-22090]ALC87692.1 hypothetical protein AM499_19180 [Bacillus sp. FJAT-22090]
MFLTNGTLGKIVMTQVKFKLNAYIGALLSLIFVQLIGLLFSTSGSGMMGTSVNNIHIQVLTLSNDLVFVFVAIWALFVGNLITTKAYRYDDFSFVTTRLSSNLANILILLIISIFAGVTTFLSNYVLRVYLSFFGNMEYMKSPGVFDDPLSSFRMVIITTLLILSLAAGGYLAGMLIQNSRVFLFIIPIFVLSILTTEIGQTLIQNIFINESTWLLILNLIIVTIVFFGIAIASSNRLEVRP